MSLSFFKAPVRDNMKLFKTTTQISIDDCRAAYKAAVDGQISREKLTEIVNQLQSADFDPRLKQQYSAQFTQVMPQAAAPAVRCR